MHDLVAVPAVVLGSRRVLPLLSLQAQRQAGQECRIMHAQDREL